MKQGFIYIAFVASLLSGCGRAGDHGEMAADAALQQDVPEPSATEEGHTQTPVERKLIKQGDIAFETADVMGTRSFITSTVTTLGGYISGDNIYDSGERISHRMTVRVPADQFDQLLLEISAREEKLDNKNIEVLDVTEDYIDVEARIKTKKELENRYLGLLAQAKTVEEVLSIEKEIGTLRTEIESFEGRLRYLKDRIGFSTLTVEFYERTASSFGFSSRFIQAMGRGMDILLWVIIALVHLWPFAGLGLLGALLYLWYQKRKRKG